MTVRLPILSAFAGILLTVSSVAQQPAPAEDYSGMYTFLKDGEFIQITIEDKGAVSGFISRFGDAENDHKTFVDQFFKSGMSSGAHLTFTTETVHGIWFQFDGSFARGPGKTPDEDAYYVVRGTLTKFNGAGRQATSQARGVEFKSFPRDVQDR